MANTLLTVLGIAVGLRAAINATATFRELKAERRWPATGQMLTVDGCRIHAQVMGEGPDVVLLHGAGGNLRDMTFRLAPELAKSYRVIAFDRPGLGYSDPVAANGASIAQQAAILQQAAGQLGADRPIVLGQSYGGAVALAWAVHHPGTLAGLVSVAGASHPWTTPLERFYRVTAHPLAGWVTIPLLTAFAGPDRVNRALAAVFAPQEVPEGYSDHFGAGLTLRRASLRANARQRANLLAEITALAPDYPQIDLPVEIVHGTRDDTVCLPLHAEQLARDVPNAQLTRLDGIGHMPHQVAPAEIVAAVDRAAARAGLR